MSDEPIYPPPPPPPRPVDTYAPPLPQEDIPSYPIEQPTTLPFDPSAPYPIEAPSAPLKPLLNPLQSGNSPMPSTIVEPPRSPNPANGATDDSGNNVELDVPSSSASVVGPADIPSTSVEPSVERPAEASDSIIPSSSFLPGIMQPTSSAGPSPSPTPVPRPFSPSSLPRDAPMPPTPNPTDEAPPILEPGLIPPAVHTPDVITTENVEEPLRSAAPPPETTQPSPLDAQPAFSAPPPQVEPPIDLDPTSAASGAPPTPPDDEQPPIPEAIPAHEPVVAPAAPLATFEAPAPPSGFEAPPPVPEAIPSSETAEMPPPVPAQTNDAMEVDAKVEDTPASDPPSSGSGFKRPGDDLEGREEKRIREEPVEPQATQAAPEESQHSHIPLPPRDPNGPPPPWESYTPPPPKYAGPTTALTSNQHKHLLNAVRNLKKNGASTNFLAPVNVELFGIPHYFRIIEKPMDLGTVETKLIVSDPRGPPKDKSKMNKWDESKGTYSSVSEVVQDVRQIWENTRKFNGPAHVVSEAATKLETTFEKSLGNLPPEPAAVQPAPVPAPAPAAAGPSHVRRPSVSQLPAIRRSSDGPDRPKREIHAPPSKELPYADAKPRRRTDSQMRWVLKTIRNLETGKGSYQHVSPFLYPVGEIIKAIPEYTNFIDRPIDLNIIKNKIEEGEYDEVHQVNNDMHLMIKNAIKFNPPTDSVAIAAKALKQIWEAKWDTLPPKNEVRDESEDPLGGDFDDSLSDQEDVSRLHKLESQVAKLQAEIASIKERQSARRAAKPKKKSKPAGRKSFSKSSPGMNGNGKKQKKHREMAFRDDDEVDSEEEARNVTMSQKQELAEKINQVDEATLTKAVDIIKETMQLSSEQEIELDIELLPPRTIYRLYNLVCRGGRRAPRSKPGQGRRSSGKKAGGARKTVNEQQEEERIRRMEQQLQNFDSGRGGMGWDGEDSESSDEESSEED